MIRLFLVVVVGMGLLRSGRAAPQYWDFSTTAGYQHGNGFWNLTDANWTTNGLAPQAVFNNGNDAYFSAVGGYSLVQIAVPVTAGLVTVNGSIYELRHAGGGTMFVANTTTIGGGSNTVAVIGGPGLTSVWDNGLATMTIAGSARSQFVIDGGGVTDSALATNIQDLNIGSASDVGVSMIVSNKGVLAVSGSIKIGRGTASETDAALIIAMGGIVRTTTNTSVGYKSSNNFDAWRLGLIVRDAESVFDGNGTRLVISELGGGGLGLCHYNNRMILDGGLITNVCFHVGVDNGGSTYYRQNENGGLMLVTNGGRMYCGAGSDDTRFHQTGGSYGGYYTINGTDIVTGVNTLWDNGGKGLVYATSVNRNDCPAATNTFVLDDGALMTNVGYLSFALRSAFNNSFVVTNGARLYSTNGMIGLSTISTGNQFIVTGSRSGTNSLWDLGGGALRIGNNASSNNALIIDRGGIVKNVATLSCSTNWNGVYLYGGTLSALNAVVANGLFTVGDGVQPALLKLASGTNSFPFGITVQPKGVFRGGGIFNCGADGVIVTNDATVEPGAGPSDAVAIGRMTINGPCTLAPQSISRFEIADASAPGSGWDILVVTNGLLSLGGFLKPVLADDFMPDFTNRFIIISNTSPGNIVNTFEMGGSERVNVLNTNMVRALGTFRVGYSNQYVVLEGFRPYSGGMGIFVK